MKRLTLNHPSCRRMPASTPYGAATINDVNRGMRRHDAVAMPAGRMHRLVCRLALALIGTGLAASAIADPPHAVVSGAHLQVIVADRPAAGYFTLWNQSDSQLTLTGASSPDCASMMLHQTVATGGMAQMSMVKQVEVPSHGSVTFAPGGYHLMCMQPSPTLLNGQKTTIVTLQFANGDTLTVPFLLQGAKP